MAYRIFAKETHAKRGDTQRL